MNARTYRAILVIVLSLAFAALACVGGGGGGGRQEFEQTKAAYESTAEYGAELWHAQQTEIAKP